MRIAELRADYEKLDPGERVELGILVSRLGTELASRMPYRGEYRLDLKRLREPRGETPD